MKKIILKTKRLVLRPIKIGDERIILSFANDSLISRWLSFDTPLSLKKEKDFVEKSVKNFGKRGFYFFVLLKKGKKFIGLIDLRDYSKEHKRANIGLWVARKHWRKGFGEEMVKAILKFGFEKLKLNRIGYNVYEGNNASETLIRKLGGKFEGIKREYLTKKGRRINEKLFSILASEWKARK